MTKIDLKKRTISGTLKPVVWHPLALETVRDFSEEIRLAKNRLKELTKE